MELKRRKLCDLDRVFVGLFYFMVTKLLYHNFTGTEAAFAIIACCVIYIMHIIKLDSVSGNNYLIFYENKLSINRVFQKEKVIYLDDKKVEYIETLLGDFVIIDRSAIIILSLLSLKDRNRLVSELKLLSNTV